MKRLFFIGCLLACVHIASAQQLKDYFIAMPDALSELLTKTNREDFADFIESRMQARVKNRLDSVSEMTQLTKDYLHIRMSAASTLQMKLLPVNDSVQVICVIQTYRAPAADSFIRFYDTAWQALPTDKFITPPQEDAFYRIPSTEKDKATLEGLRKCADMYLLEARLSETNTDLQFFYATPSYLDKETRKQIMPFVNAQGLRYRWINGAFVRE